MSRPGTLQRPATIARPGAVEDRSALPDWYVLLGLVLIIASDYKFRRRSLAESLSGSLDFMILLELGLFGIVVLVMASQHLKWGRPSRPSPLMVSMWVYCGILAASSLYAPFPNLAVVRAGQLLVIAAFAQTLADRATPLQFRLFTRWFIGLMIISILAGIAYVAPTSNYQEGRFTWLHVHTVTAASVLCVALLMNIGLLTIPPPKVRPRWATMVLLGTAAAITGALIMTKTRGSLGGAVVGVLVYTVLRVSPRKRNGVVALMLVGMGGILYFTLPMIEAFITRGESAESVTTLSNRTVLWSVAWEDFLQKPLFGWGLTASRGLFFDAVQLGGAHNAVVNAGVDGGLIGLTAWTTWLVTLAVVMRRTWRLVPSARPTLSLCAALMACMLVNGLTMEGIGSGAGGVFIIMCMLSAWVTSLRRTAPAAIPVPPSAPTPRGS